MNNSTIHTIDQVNPVYKATKKVDHPRMALRHLNRRLEELREVVDEIESQQYRWDDHDRETAGWYLDNYMRALSHNHENGEAGAIVTQADIDQLIADYHEELNMEAAAEQAAERAAEFALAFPGDRYGPGPDDERERYLESLYLEEAEANYDEPGPFQGLYDMIASGTPEEILDREAERVLAEVGMELYRSEWKDGRIPWVPGVDELEEALDNWNARRSNMTELERLEEDFLAELADIEARQAEREAGVNLLVGSDGRLTDETKAAQRKVQLYSAYVDLQAAAMDKDGRMSAEAQETYALALRYTVAVSVGVALVVGVFRILKGWPIQWFIIAGYLVVVALTAFAPEDIIGVAYDSGGVTTSTVTVPLVTALGLGLASVLRGRNPMIDGFGLIAFASLTPIIFVLIFGMLV